MKIKHLIISHLAVAILSPVLLVGGIGIYAQHKIAQLENQDQVIEAFNSPHQILAKYHNQDPMMVLTNDRAGGGSP